MRHLITGRERFRRLPRKQKEESSKKLKEIEQLAQIILILLRNLHHKIWHVSIGMRQNGAIHRAFIYKIHTVLTAVGLLPIAVSGADIDKLMEGAASGRELALNKSFADNDAMQYAAVRNILLRKGKVAEVMANYEPGLHYISEWWKQLYGESEGKDQKGILIIFTEKSRSPITSISPAR